MFINVPWKAASNINRGKINLNDLHLKPMPDDDIIVEGTALIDSQIAKPYDNPEFFKTPLTFRRVICRCEDNKNEDTIQTTHMTMTHDEMVENTRHTENKTEFELCIFGFIIGISIMKKSRI